MAKKQDSEHSVEDADEMAKERAAKVLEEAKALEESGYENLADGPEPMTMCIVSQAPEEQGPFIIINTSDFNPEIHTPYDDTAKRIVARRRARLRKQLADGA